MKKFIAHIRDSAEEQRARIAEGKIVLQKALLTDNYFRVYRGVLETEWCTALLPLNNFKLENRYMSNDMGIKIHVWHHEMTFYRTKEYDPWYLTYRKTHSMIGEKYVLTNVGYVKLNAGNYNRPDFAVQVFKDGKVLHD